MKRTLLIVAAVSALGSTAAYAGMANAQSGDPLPYSITSGTMTSAMVRVLPI